MSLSPILMVEDQTDLLAIISEALAGLGYQVFVATNGLEALEQMRGDVQFDHIISDVSMPEGISGIDLVGHAAQLQPQARFVLVSGYIKAQLPPLPDGVRFLPKPYRLGQLLEALKA
jgi:two-component system, cell cycle response regulator CpdR